MNTNFIIRGHIFKPSIQKLQTNWTYHSPEETGALKPNGSKSGMVTLSAVIKVNWLRKYQKIITQKKHTNQVIVSIILTPRWITNYTWQVV